MIAILIGPMGCGKTTIGKLVSEQLGWQFLDADDFHSTSSVYKMSRAIPLTDSDRSTWLQKLNKMIAEKLSNGEDAVLACSALKESYREKLGVNQTTIKSIYLKVPPGILQLRVESREHRFMNAELLESQLSITEEPQDGFIVDASQDPSWIVSLICNHLSG